MFEAFEEYKHKLVDDPVYVKLLREINSASKLKDICTGSMSHKQIDTDWVEAIENCLPHIDVAIREQRRFIENNEEIVGIERAKRITSESVRHLAQHTNMISSVEDGKVTPERILTVNREESFAVYENRFIFTLLKNIMHFIDKRFEVLKGIDDNASFSFSLNRSFNIGEESVGIDVGYTYSKIEKVNKVSLTDDVTALSEFERVLRIRQITMNFLDTPLMKLLKNAEPIRPPLVKTNAMKKNPHLIKAVDLYVFLEQYSRPGYTISHEKDDAVLNVEIKNELSNVFALAYFIVKVGTDSSFRQGLSLSYLNKVKAVQAAQEQAEKERVSQTKNLLDAAKKELELKYLGEIDKLNGQLKMSQEKMNYYKMNYVRTSRLVNSLNNELKRLAQKMDSELKFSNALKLKEIEALKTRWEDFLQNEREMRDEQIFQVQQACRELLVKQKQDHEKEIEKIQAVHKKEIERLKKQYQQEIQNLKDNQ